MSRFSRREVAGALLVGVALLTGGCSKLWLTPASVKHVTAGDFSAKAPAIFQERNSEIPKAFVVTSEQNLKAFWGEGEPLPKIDFTKESFLVVFTSVSSEGPGSLEIWVLKCRETEDGVEARVKESLAGAWPISAGWSRAYDIVRIPKSTQPVKVHWEYMWGERDDMRELQAEEWVPTGGGQSGWPTPGAWPSTPQQTR